MGGMPIMLEHPANICFVPVDVIHRVVFKLPPTARAVVSTLGLPVACVVQLMTVTLLHLLAKCIAS